MLAEGFFSGWDVAENEKAGRLPEASLALDLEEAEKADAIGTSVAGLVIAVNAEPFAFGTEAKEKPVLNADVAGFGGNVLAPAEVEEIVASKPVS